MHDLTPVPLTRLGWHEPPTPVDVPDDRAIGRVINQQRGRWSVAGPEGTLLADLAGRHRRDHPNDPPAVGDWVVIAPRRYEGAATIHDIVARRTALVRKVAGVTSRAQVIAANVDTVLITVPLDVDPNPRRIERQLATAWESGATPYIVATKTDLSANLDDALAVITECAPGVETVAVSSRTGEGLEGFAASIVSGQTYVLLGTSGAGKSTLANYLAGADVMATSEVRNDGKGRHTTTSRELLVLPSGALLIDTPGLRELALWFAAGSADDDERRGVAATFDDVDEAASLCRFSNCAHDGDRGCAIEAGLADGSLAPDRVESWKRLGREQEWVVQRHDALSRADERRRWAALSREGKGRARP